MQQLRRQSLPPAHGLLEPRDYNVLSDSRDLEQVTWAHKDIKAVGRITKARTAVVAAAIEGLRHPGIHYTVDVMVTCYQILSQPVLIFFQTPIAPTAINMPSIIDKLRAWRLCSATELIFSLARLLANILWIAWILERKTSADRDSENGDGIVERSVSVN